MNSNQIIAGPNENSRVITAENLDDEESSDTWSLSVFNKNQGSEVFLILILKVFQNLPKIQKVNK